VAGVRVNRVAGVLHQCSCRRARLLQAAMLACHLRISLQAPGQPAPYCRCPSSTPRTEAPKTLNLSELRGALAALRCPLSDKAPTLHWQLGVGEVTKRQS
jgi:hypothetical protein